MRTESVTWDYRMIWVIFVSNTNTETSKLSCKINLKYQQWHLSRISDAIHTKLNMNWKILNPFMQGFQIKLECFCSQPRLSVTRRLGHCEKNAELCARIERNCVKDISAI